VKTDLANALLLVASLALASWATLVPTESGHDATAQVERAEQVVPVDAPDKVTDARGHTAPVRDYARVVSLNTVSDHVLLELVEPDRLVAITELTLTAHPEAFRFGDLVGVGRSDQLETILGLDPDLVLVSAYADEAFMARLRESGIQVFDLGQMRGVATTLDSIRTLGHLLGQPERAAVVADRYQRQLAGLEAAVPEDQRPHGLYLTVYSDVLYGGSVGSSYGDMLRYGGVHDIAPDHGFKEWPQYTPEQLLQMDPSLIITQSGMGTVICGHSLLREVAACEPGGRVVEVASRYDSDPGLGLVEAAASVMRAVHPELSAQAP